MFKNILSYACIFLTIFFITGCKESINFEPPELSGRVVDTTNTLSKQEKQNIENAIIQFEKETGGQFAVCIVPDIKDETIESASIKVAEAWKIGNKEKDDGIIFFITMKERQFRLEIGYGYESKINDGKAGDITRAVTPFFKEGKWGEGIVFAINSCNSIITGKQITVQSQENTEENENQIPLGFIIVIAILLFIIFASGGNGSYGYYNNGGSSYKGGSSYRGGGGSFGGGGSSGSF